MTTTEPAVFRPNVVCLHGASPEPYSPVSVERMREVMRFYDADQVGARMLATLDHERSVMLGLIQRLADRLGPDERDAVAAEIDHELAVFRRAGVEMAEVGR